MAMTSTEQVKIAVILIVKDQCVYIDQAITSVLKQLSAEDRLVLIDDGSTDGTDVVCERYRDNSKVDYVGFKKSKGLTWRLIDAIDCLPDEMVVLRQDGDDLSLPGRIARFRELFSSQTEVKLVASEVEFIDEGGVLIGTSMCSRARVHNLDMRFGNFLVHGSVGFRKRDYVAVGGYDRRLRFAQDFALWRRWIDTFGDNSIFICDQPLYALRKHFYSVSIQKRWAQTLSGLMIIGKCMSETKAWDDVSTVLGFYVRIIIILCKCNLSADSKVDAGIYLLKNRCLIGSVILLFLGLKAWKRLLQGIMHVLILRSKG